MKIESKIKAIIVSKKETPYDFQGSKGISYHLGFVYENEPVDFKIPKSLYDKVTDACMFKPCDLSICTSFSQKNGATVYISDFGLSTESHK